MFPTETDGRLRRFVLPVLVGALLAVAGCGGSNDEPASQSGVEELLTGGVPGDDPVRGGTLVFDQLGEPVSFDPLVGADTFSAFTLTQMIDGLVRYLPGDREPQPALASSWTISDDGMTYTFELRPDVRFSDGSPVRTEDVEFSLERLDDPEQNQFFTFLTEFIERVDVSSSSEVRVTLSAPVPAFLDYLAIGIGGIVPQATFERLGAERFGRNPVGTGPFMLRRWVQGQRLELVRNPHYWEEGKPYLDGVTFRTVADGNTRLLDLRSGEADVIGDVPFQQIDNLSRTQGVKVLLEAFNASDDIWLNNGKEPLSDVEVRRALVMATPRKAIAEAVYRGKVELSSGLLPKLDYWGPAIKALPHDPARARRTLADSTGGENVALTILTIGGDAESRQTATILQRSWGEIGIEVAVRQLDQATVYARLAAGDYDVVVFPPGLLVSGTNAPDQLATNLQDGTSGTDANGSFYNSEEATRLVQQATTSTDEAEREGLFVRLQRLGIADAQLIPLFYLPSRTGVTDAVRGFETLPGGGWRLERTYLQE